MRQRGRERVRLSEHVGVLVCQQPLFSIAEMMEREGMEPNNYRHCAARYVTGKVCKCARYILYPSDASQKCSNNAPGGVSAHTLSAWLTTWSFVFCTVKCVFCSLVRVHFLPLSGRSLNPFPSQRWPRVNLWIIDNKNEEETSESNLQMCVWSNFRSMGERKCKFETISSRRRRKEEK